MHIPPEVSQSVAFVACQKKSERKLMGTCFFVGLPAGNQMATYAVTARHVIEESDKRSVDGQIWIRMNRLDGGSEFVSTNLTDWQFHENAHVDVAVTSFGIDFSQFEQKLIPAEMFLYPDTTHKGYATPGCELFFPGLFVKRPGDERNVPIVRTGTIAAMPGESISTEWGSIVAYLIEARSIGGLSGSPVFLKLGIETSVEKNLGWRSHLLLLGLVHGHYGMKNEFGDTTEFDVTDIMPSDFRKSVNMGIGMVIPMADIEDVLNLPTFLAHRVALEALQACYVTELVPPPVVDESLVFTSTDAFEFGDSACWQVTLENGSLESIAEVESSEREMP